MRLTSNEIQAIKTVAKQFAPDAHIFLFGSRVDDSRKGGDIDLLIIGNNIDRSTIRAMKIALKDMLGDQKLDIVAEAPDGRTNFGKLIELEAVEL